MQFASHHSTICSLDLAALVGRKVVNKDSFSTAHFLLNEAFEEVHEKRAAADHVESPFFLLPDTLRFTPRLFKSTTYSFRQKTRTYLLWVYEDKSAILGLQDVGEDGYRIVPLGFHLASSLNAEDQFFSMRMRKETPYIGYAGRSCAGITPLFGKERGAPPEASLARRTYKKHLRRDITAIVAAIETSAPLAHRLDDPQAWQNTSKVIPYFVTHIGRSEHLDLFRAFVSSLDIFLHVKNPDAGQLEYITYGRRVLASGHLSNTKFHIRQNYNHAFHKLSEWVNNLLVQDNEILPPIHQFHQTTGEEHLLLFDTSIHYDKASAHQKVEAVLFIEDLMKRYPLPGFDAENLPQMTTA